MDGPAIEGGPAAPAGSVQLPGQRRIYHGVLHLPILGQRHGDVGVGKAPDEVGGAVDGVHDEGPRRRQGIVLPLLPEEIRLRQQGQQLLPQKALYRQIVLRHQIRRAVLLMGGRRHVAGAADQLPGPAHNIDDTLQHSSYLLMMRPGRAPVSTPCSSNGTPAARTVSIPAAMRQGS